MPKQLRYTLLFVIIFSLALISYFCFYSNLFHNNSSHTDKPNIVLITLPKSGSTFLLSLLQENLGYEVKNFGSFYVHGKKIFVSNIDDVLAQNGIIVREHFRAPINFHRGYNPDFMDYLDIEKLKANTNKIVLHIRDPHQTLLSLIHHIRGNPVSPFVPRQVRPWFYEQTLSTQIDWGIENLLPSTVEWINNWLEYKAIEDLSPDGLKILVTTYDEILNDDFLLYQKILNFYDIKLDATEFKLVEKNSKVRFRTGDPNEWRQVYTHEQKEKMSTIIPKDLLERFGWG